jgi:cation diffusion facilitator family transporter
MTMSRLTLLAFGSLLIALVVLGLKGLAYFWTGSVALYSDALETVINVVAALMLLAVIHWSSKPADEGHPYGHHKAEYFSAVFEGVLIVLAALSILYEAYQSYLHATSFELSAEALAVSCLAGVINAVWCGVLIREGQKHRSPAISADGRHLLADVLSSAGVITGVIIAQLTGIAVLDPILAFLVALNILWSGWVLIRDSVGGLMDAAPSNEIVTRIRAIIGEQGDGALEAHELRMRQAGQAIFIDFHLVVPGEFTVRNAHAICDRIEQKLETEIQGAVVTIHIEPEDEAKQSGVVVL